MSEENSSKSFDGRQMPADIEAERCLLGGILRDPEVMGIAVMAITDDDFFYLERHQLIWNALCSLNKAVSPIDPVTVSAELTKMGKLDIVGGREYIFELMESVASSANVPWQLEHLRNKAVLRKLIRTSSEIIRKSMDPASTPDNVLQDAERDIFAIADNQVRNTLKSIDNFVSPLLERLNNRKDGMTGVPTGITELDELTNGLQNSDLIILAARPGVGKTSFALTVAANAAIRYGKNVAFFSLEMDGMQLAQRLLCSQAQVDQSKLRNGKLNHDEMKKLIAAEKKEIPAFVCCFVEAYKQQAVIACNYIGFLEYWRNTAISDKIRVANETVFQTIPPATSNKEDPGNIGVLKRTPASGVLTEEEMAETQKTVNNLKLRQF